MSFKNKYLIAWVLFIISLIAIWFVFIYKDWIATLDQRLTFILASIGVFFGIFQFTISNIKEKEKWVNEIKLEEYRKIRDLIQRFINTVNAGLSDNSTPIDTENLLINLKNELSVCINSNDAVVFPGIAKQETSKKLEAVFNKIIEETSKARKRHQTIIDSLQDSKEIKLEILKMEWGMSIYDILHESFVLQNKLLKELQYKIMN